MGPFPPSGASERFRLDLGDIFYSPCLQVSAQGDVAGHVDPASGMTSSTGIPNVWPAVVRLGSPLLPVASWEGVADGADWF